MSDEAPSSLSTHSGEEDTGSLTGGAAQNATANDSLSSAFQSFLRQDAEEQGHWDDVCRAYRQYATFAVRQFGLQHLSRLENLPASQRGVLPDHLVSGTPAYQERLRQFKEAAIRNQFCLDCILRHAGQPHSQQNTVEGAAATEAQMSKVSSVLKSLARDWSKEGQVERDMSYTPLLESVARYLPQPAQRRKICVPGAGVGRLALELVARGYTVQGNEFSLYMLLASDFILNGPVQGKALSISPWLLETRNLNKATDPLRIVQIPDVDPFAMACGKSSSTTAAAAAASTPSTAVEQEGKGLISSTHNDNTNSRNQGRPKPSKVTQGADFSMAAGDFVSIYSADSEASCWDAVVACFFLDASPSIVQSLQVIHHMLLPGGYLIGFGPLHWHWSGPAMLLSDATLLDYQERHKHLDQRYLQSIDFTWEDVEQILINIGLEICEIRHDVPALYTADRQSMLRTEYRCVHFVARKKGPKGKSEKRSR